jgi:NAD(P)H-hydrate epimerase
MQEIDKITIHDFHISDELLMENAGFEFANSFIDDFTPEKTDRIAVLCGGGNNGGDGFVIARHLKRRGYSVCVFLFVPWKKLRGIALENLKRLSLFNVQVEDLSSVDEWDRNNNKLFGHRFYIDALLGIGFSGIPRGMIKKAIEAVNRQSVPVISIDMPSGVDADGGQGELLAVHARATYTVGLLKFGLVDYPGKELAGKVRVLDIGFPLQAVEKIPHSVFFIDAAMVDALIPERKGYSHKGSYGHLAVIGGRQGYEGASLLAARAASRGGSGLITVYFSKGRGIIKPDEIIEGYFPAEIENLPEDLDYVNLFGRHNALIIGPGLGIFPAAAQLIKHIISLDKKVLIDADGLNNIAVNPEVLKDKVAEIVITPHIGEMARLTSLTKENVKAHKREVAQEFSKKYGVTVVLKDAVSVIATQEGKVFINNGGVSALSKGGSGDVLSGIIGSLMARGLSGKDAAIAGVWLHTECGRIAGERLYSDCVGAGDLILMLPEAFRKLRKYH